MKQVKTTGQEFALVLCACTAGTLNYAWCMVGAKVRNEQT